MEHHRCFRVYVAKTRVTQISDTVFFKQQYITNPTVSLESHMVTAAQHLTIALQQNIRTDNKTAEALQKLSKLFTKKTMAKKRGSKGQGQMQQGSPNPSGTTNNAPSKGGSTHSKGGNTNSKGDHKPGGTPHPS
jgi:hypothetical protein